MKIWQKTIAVISTLALLLNSLAAPLSVLAQTVDETPSPTPETIIESTPIPEEVIAPTPDSTPAEIATTVPEETPVATDLVTPTPTDAPVVDQAPESNQTVQGPPEANNQMSEYANMQIPSPTPEVPTETGKIAATIFENTTVDTSALDAFDLSYQTDGSAVIVTDKLDYSPYDTAFITGSGFIAGKTYQLTISSTDPEPTSTTVNVTASETGTIMYAYELDHTYRPNYTVVVKDGERLVAETTFTDSDYHELNLSGTGTGKGRITSSIGSMDCYSNAGATKGTCTQTYPKSDSVTLTATADLGSTFSGWTHDCSGTSTTCTLPLDHDRDVTASFIVPPPKTNTTISVSSSTNPSTYGSSVTFTATVSHTSGSNSPTGTVNIKDDTTTTICTTGSLSETSHTASCSTSALLVVGSPHTITAVYAGDINYNGSTSGAISQVVNKKSVTASVTASNKTYDGNNNATIATCTLSGVLAGDSGNVTCATGSATFADKNVGNSKSVTATGITLSGTAAGNYQLSSTSAATTANITTRDITVTADAKSKVFGAGDPALTYQITGGSLISGDVFSGSLNRVTGENFGTYAIQKNTLSVGGNYNLTYIGANFTISKAPSSVVVTFEAGPYTYRGSAFTATANVTGAGGLNQSVGVVYSGDCVNVTSSNGCTATATFAGDTNHNGSSDPKSITINKADANVTVNGYTGTYDGNPHGATGTATGIGGALLTGLTLGASFTNVPGGTATWSFTNTNYADETGTVNIIIGKAGPVIVITPYDVTYDATAHTATGTVKGVKTENLAGLDLSGTTHTNAGDYLVDPWTFIDVTGNYNNTNGTVHNKIGKATSTTIVTCPSSVAFTGSAVEPCTASYSGIGSLSGSLTPTYLNNVAVGIATADASYAGDLNHTGSSDSKTFEIIDYIPPTGSWVNPTDKLTVSGIVPLEVTADDLGSGVKEVEFLYRRVGDLGDFTPIAKVTEIPYTTNWDTRTLDLDDYTLRAVIRDNANNWIEKDIEVGVAAVISAEDGMGSGYTTAIISWTTDRPTKSKVVYDTVQHPTLDLTDPNYGYAFSTGTYDEGKVLSHAVTLSGLSVGTMYFYRTISEGSPKAISGEHYIITNTNAGPPDTSGGGGAVLGVSTAVPLTTWPKLSFAGDVAAEESILGTETTDTISPEVLAASDQPEKVGFIKWVLTHKKISLGVVFALIVILYLLRRRKKS
jgi:hypothetical protein